MNLSEQPLAGPSVHKPVPQQMPSASGRTQAELEPSAGFSDIVEFIAELENNQSSEPNEIDQVQNVITSGIVPAGAYMAKGEFFEFTGDVETVAPEMAASSQAPMNLVAQSFDPQEIGLETVGPTESVATVVANYVDDGKGLDITPQSPHQPEVESIPVSDTNVLSTQMGEIDPALGLGVQNTRDAQVADGTWPMVRSAGDATERSSVPIPRDDPRPLVLGRSLPTDVRENDAEGSDQVNGGSQSGHESRAERIADSPLQKPKFLATQPVQLVATTSLVNQPHSQLVEHDTGLPGEQDTGSLAAHRDRPGLTSVGQTETRASPQMPLGPQGRNMQNVRDALANLRPDGSVEIALDPPELGRIRLAMSGHEHQMSVVITVDRPEVLDVIRRQIDLLKTELTAQGFTQFDFDFQRNDRESTGPMTLDAEFSGTDETDMHVNGHEQIIRLPNGRMDIRI